MLFTIEDVWGDVEGGFLISDIFEFSNDDPITPRVSNPQLSLGSDSKLQITVPQDNSLLEILNPKSYLQRENESLKKQASLMVPLFIPPRLDRNH